jgi:hypothetical protein
VEGQMDRDKGDYEVTETDEELYCEEEDKKWVYGEICKEENFFKTNKKLILRK